jgi:proteasome beta subunit
VKDVLPLAVRAIGAAMKRDVFSGGKVDLTTITKEGFRRYKREEIDRLIEKDKAIGDRQWLL